mgnify:CR=1 FL=1
MSKEYRFYVHSLVNVYVFDTYENAFKTACELAESDEFIMFYDCIKDFCIHHIDELVTYNENMKI